MQVPIVALVNARWEYIKNWFEKALSTNLVTISPRISTDRIERYERFDGGSIPSEEACSCEILL